MSQEQPMFDQTAVEKFSEKMGMILQDAMTMALCCLGEQLGLYQAMAQTGAVTSAELAASTHLHERWLREWLQQQACTGVLAYEGNGRFALRPEAREVLVNENSLLFAGGALTVVMDIVQNAPNLKHSFQTGLGLPYDTFGCSCAVGLDRMGSAWKRQKLVSDVLPQMKGVLDTLQQGALVADIGCGAGTALLVLAQAFPHSQFHGYDTSQHALAEARQRTSQAGLTNLFWHHPGEDLLPADRRFDLVTTFDVIHDTTAPAEVIAAVYKAVKPDGTWLLNDVTGKASFEENLRDHPLAGLFYSFSVLICMSAGLSQPGGAGLGTVGFHQDLAQQMTAAAGFTHFRRLEIEDPFNNYYEVRP